MISAFLCAALVSTEPAIRPQQGWHDAFEIKKAYVATNTDVRVAFAAAKVARGG